MSVHDNSEAPVAKTPETSESSETTVSNFLTIPSLQKKTVIFY